MGDIRTDNPCYANAWRTLRPVHYPASMNLTSWLRVRDAGFFEQILKCSFDGRFRGTDLIGDPAVGETVQDSTEHSLFTFRKRIHADVFVVRITLGEETNQIVIHPYVAPLATT